MHVFARDIFVRERGGFTFAYARNGISECSRDVLLLYLDVTCTTRSRENSESHITPGDQCRGNNPEECPAYDGMHVHTII